MWGFSNVLGYSKEVGALQNNKYPISGWGVRTQPIARSWSLEMTDSEWWCVYVLKAHSEVDNERRLVWDVSGDEAGSSGPSPHPP